MLPFHPLFRNAHLQTIAGHFWARDGGEARFPPVRRLFRTEPEVEVLVESQRPERRAAGHIIMVHGMEGSGSAGYVRSLSGMALAAGFAAHRFHMRTCGGTERLSPTLYHGGLTSDLISVLRQFRAEGDAPVFLVGFSLGGNVVLKLAGEMGGSAGELMAGVCAVSSPIDLGVCARRISAPENRVYERRFVRRMRARLCATGRYRAAEFAGLRTVEAIDNRITAPSFGFGNAEHYYQTQSAIRFLPGILVPTLLVQAEDDTFIPFELFASPAVRANPRIELWATEHGGHLGFLATHPHRFWADAVIMEWIAQH